MHHAKRLGLRIAAFLVTSGAIATVNVLGCSGSVSESGSSGNAGGNGGNNGSGGATNSASSSSNGSTSGGPMCPFNPAERQCFTLDEIENQINNPFPPGSPIPDGGDADAGPDGGGIMLTECPEPSVVHDGCCNAGMAGPEMDGELCCYWFCTGACCGRAFTIEGQARLADTTNRDDWCGDWSVSPNDLNDITRDALANAWREDARMEHASIASFARFTMELLALGAPAEIIAASQSASLDEVQHAQLCFALASRFSGQATGPGPLDMSAALRATSLAECAGWTVIEGCIGETIAALTARAQLEMVRDEETLRALSRIAEDEERHAELAWRFVAWALAVGGASVRMAVEQAFDEGMRQVRAHKNAEMPGIDENAWHEFGRLTGREMDQVAEQALAEAILPNVAMLLAGGVLDARSSQSTAMYATSASNTPAYT